MSRPPGSVAPGFPDPATLPGSGRILIAFSGGADSVCLAGNMVESKPSRPLLAVHIDHGLDEFSSQRAARAQTLADQLGLALQVERLDPAPRRGGEAAARDARYRIFTQLLSDDELLVTGHHADDQAETVLLRLLRGAGAQGMKGIPQQRRLGAGWLARPLLRWPRSKIIEWLQARELRWQDDPTNTDLGIDRNFLRHRVLPLLESRWPSLRQRLNRSADLALGAAEALDELAAMDLEHVQGRWQTVDHDRLKALSRFRQGQVLRLWCVRLGVEPPPGRRIDVFLDQIGQAASDRQPSMEWQGHRLSLWRHKLWLHPCPPDCGGWHTRWDGQQPLTLPGRLGKMSIDGAGSTEVRSLTLRFGRHGERIHLPNQKHSQAVRQLMADLGIPPWQRDQWPRIERGGRLLAVGSRWLDRAFAAELERLDCEIRWLEPPPEFVC